jgi:hypothetical protein
MRLVRWSTDGLRATRSIRSRSRRSSVIRLLLLPPPLLLLLLEALDRATVHERLEDRRERSDPDTRSNQDHRPVLAPLRMSSSERSGHVDRRKVVVQRARDEAGTDLVHELTVHRGHAAGTGRTTREGGGTTAMMRGGLLHDRTASVR